MLLRAAPPAPKQGRTVQVKNDVLTPHPRPQTACPVPAAPVPGLRQASVIGRQARSGVVGLLEREGELAAAVGVLDRGGVFVVEGGAGIGKSALLDAVCGRAAQAGWQVVRARGSELEAGFAFGVVRQLFERHLAMLDPGDRDELLAGPAAATGPLWGEAGAGGARDTSFAVLHGLYWLTANLAAVRPVLVVVDDAHWADGPSLRWLAYLAPRMGGLAAGLLVAVRPAEPASGQDPRLAALGGEGVAARVAARVRRLGPRALSLAQALAVLGDGCQLRHAAGIAGLGMERAARLTARLVRAEVLAGDEPPRFLHPIVREAVEASLGGAGRDAAHRAAAGVLHQDGAPAGQVAAHLLRVRPTGDGWVLARLREAAAAALETGAPQAAAGLLARALAEPPPPDQRVECLREAARAEVTAGQETACARLEQALSLAADPRQRAEITLELAEVYAKLNRRAEAVDVLERVLAELGETDPALAARLEGVLVLSGFAYGQPTSRVAPVLERLSARPLSGAAADARAVARGLAMHVAGRPVDETAPPLERVLARAGSRPENWIGPLLWTLVTCERFEAVEAALGPMLAEAHRSGSASGLMNTHTILGLLKLRLGALPEADAAARVAVRVAREGDFAPGTSTLVLADVAVERGELEEAQALLALLSGRDWPGGLTGAEIYAARGRLRL